VPFIAADAGSLFGGWLSGYLIGIGWSVDKARKSIICASMFLMCFGIPAVMVKSSITALGLIAVVMFGFQSWISNVQTLPSDYFPEVAVGSVTGMGGVGAGLGAILFTQTTGFVVDHYSYTPILITAALLPIFATLVLFKLGGRIRPISI
jgi:ACS family hexuronate transporter-like MFS transporter